jgi:hypothetical protein
MSKHPTKFVPLLEADIDAEVWTLVKAINGFGFETVSSCQGDPGIIGEDGNYGHVAFMFAESPFDYTRITEFTFKFLRSFFAHKYDDVTLEVTLSEQNGFVGWLRFRNEALDDVTRRLYVYREIEGQ